MVLSSLETIDDEISIDKNESTNCPIWVRPAGCFNIKKDVSQVPYKEVVSWPSDLCGAYLHQ